MKAIILARVSTEEQRAAGNSLPAQQERLRNYIERTPNLNLEKEFVFDESAYKGHRTEFGKVLDFIKEQKETVALCCDKIDRLSRDFLLGVVELEQLRREGKIELHFASDGISKLHKHSNAGDILVYNILLSAAQNYSNAISDNVKRAFETKRKNGEWAGKPSIGYVNVTTEDGRKDIVPDPERAHLIQRLFELYATGKHSLTTLWNEMTRLGLRGLNGQKLSRSNIERILKDTFYYGMARSKTYGLYPHRYEPLISRNLFDACQSIMSGRRKTPYKALSKPFIFRGLLKCKRCGCLMTPEKKTKKSGREFIYYSCANGKKMCDGRKEYVPEKVLLEPVYNVFKEFENIPHEAQERLVSELRKVHDGETRFHELEVSRIREEYARTQNRIDALLDLRLDGSITHDEYDKKLQKLKDTQFRLNTKLDEYTKADHQYHIHVNDVIDVSRRIRQIFDGSGVEEKRAILDFLLQNPVVEGKKLGFAIRSPFDAVLELARRPLGQG